MSYTESGVRKACSRLRRGELTPADQRLLLEYRNERAQVLVPACGIVQSILAASVGVFTARLKRYESITRKLIRQQTAISRLDDVVGIRVIVDSRRLQDEVCDRLRRRSEHKRSKDYRDSARSDGYRCSHEILSVAVGDAIHSVEVQVRTLFQHLWASFSESLGQQVKEGGGTAEQRDYLLKLSAELKVQDDTVKNQQLEWRQSPGALPEFRILSFDLKTKRVTEESHYQDDLDFALTRLAFLEGQTQQTSELESVLMCSRHPDMARITHIRYFPSTLVAELVDNAQMAVPDWAIAKLLFSTN